MIPDSPHPPPPVSSDSELTAFLTAATPRRDIPPKILREAYSQIAPIRGIYEAIFFVVLGVFFVGLGMVVGFSRILQTYGRDALMPLMGILLIAVSLWSGRKYFKRRAYCRNLLKTGLVDEFLVVGAAICASGAVSDPLKEKNKVLFYAFRLKPANWNDDKHLYVSHLTKENQVEYAKAVLRAKTATFGLYDPTDAGKERRVFMIEALFHGAGI